MSHPTILDHSAQRSANQALDWLVFVFLGVGLWVLFAGAFQVSTALQTTAVPDLTNSVIGVHPISVSLFLWLQAASALGLGLLVLAGTYGAWRRRWYVVCLATAGGVSIVPWGSRFGIEHCPTLAGGLPASAERLRTEASEDEPYFRTRNNLLHFR